MAGEHLFEGSLDWEGQPESRAYDYENLNRRTTIEFGDARIDASAPAVFHGDDGLANPETLMIGSLMQCHFLTFMAVAIKSGVRVTGYSDRASGRLGMKDGRMRFVEVVLRPTVTLADPAHVERLAALHERAHRNCFMSNSVNFEVRVEPEFS